MKTKNPSLEAAILQDRTALEFLRILTEEGQMSITRLAPRDIPMLIKLARAGYVFEKGEYIRPYLNAYELMKKEMEA